MDVERYLAQRGLTLGAVSASLPEGLGAMAPGPQLGVVLSGVDPRRLHRGHLAEVMIARQRQRSFELACLLLEVWEWACAPVVDGGTVVRAAEAHRYAAKELAPLLNWSVYRCEQALDWARLAVKVAPALVRALRSGLLDEQRLAVIARELRGIEDEELVRHIVAVVLAEMATHTPTTLAEHIRRELAVRDPEPVRRTREQALAQRRVSRRNGPGGLTRLTLGHCDAATGAAAEDHVDAIARAIVAAGDPLGRTLDQLRCDVGADLLCGVAPEHAGRAEADKHRKGTINLTLGLDTLVGLDDDHAVLAGYGPVTAAVARQTAAQFADACRWRFQLYDERDGHLINEGQLPPRAVRELVAGLRRWVASGDRHPIDVTAGADGRGHREPTQAQKAFVRARDRHCQHPGCRIPARRCDIDHRIAWIDGGQTIVSNLFAVCRAHHRFKHFYGLSYEPGLGALVWDILGRRYATLHQTPPGLRRDPVSIQHIAVELTAYQHGAGPPPHLRQ